MRDFHGFTVGRNLILQLNNSAIVAFDSDMNILVDVKYPDRLKTILGSCSVVLPQSGNDVNNKNNNNLFNVVQVGGYEKDNPGKNTFLCL
jgi:hypothetical protein